MAAMRLYAAAALGLIALTTTTAHAATTRIRVAIPEFQLEGSPPPALGIQLQDGFVLGWVRAGAHVLDPADTAKKLDGHPELPASRLVTAPDLAERTTWLVDPAAAG